VQAEPVGARGDQRRHAVERALGLARLELHAPRLREHLDAAAVRVLVGAHEELVALARWLAAEQVLARAELRAEVEGSLSLLDGALRGDPERQARLALERREQAPGLVERERGADVLARLAAPLARPLDPLLVGLVVREPALVAHPDLVHFLVAAREQPVELRAAALDVGVAAVRTTGADAGALVDEPDARLEAEVGVQERADRAYIDRITRIVAIERLPGKRGYQGMVAAIDHRELRLLRDLVHEAHAAGAHDAALGVVDDHGPELFALGLLQLVRPLPRGLVVVLHVVVLQLALARLIADGAVDRVVDEVELHHAALVLLHRGRVGEDLQTLLHLHLAAGLEAARLIGRLDQAHAALAGDREARVVAKIGDGLVGAARGLDEVVARIRLDRDAIDFNFDHLDWNLRAHCSTSPPIMLMLSKMGIRSPSEWPCRSRGSAPTMGKPGART